jgi:hypothetical protein
LVDGLNALLLGLPLLAAFPIFLLRTAPVPATFLALWMLGLALNAWAGASLLRVVDALCADGRGRAQRAWRLGICQVGLGPFVPWFIGNSGSYYFAANVFLLLLCVSWWLVLLNEGVAALAAAQADRALRGVALLGAWGCLLLHAVLQVFLAAQVLWHRHEIGGTQFPALLLRPWREAFLLPFLVAWLVLARARARVQDWWRQEPPDFSPDRAGSARNS